MKAKHVFESPLAGHWFSVDKSELTHELQGLRPTTAPEPVPGVCAVIVPHAGYRYSGGVAASVFTRLDRAAYDRVVILGPSHHAQLPNRVSVARATGYATPLGTSPADVEWMDRLCRLPEVVEQEEVHLTEHSDQIQVPLIQHFLGLDLPLVCLVCGHFSADARREFAARFRLLLDRRTLVVASTDFTHFGPYYGYQPFAGHAVTVAAKLRDLDEEVFDAFASKDEGKLAEVLEVTGATVCGRETLFLLLALKPTCGRATRVAYTTSGAVTQNWTNSVSYVGAILQGVWDSRDEDVRKLTDADGRILLAMAREVIQHAAQHRSAPPASLFEDRITPPLQRTAGTFVTLTLGGRLRGCIGEVIPARPLWVAVHDHARNAAVSDFRFRPVTPAEVPGLHIEISVLSPPTPVPSWCEIEVGRHGVVIHKAGCCAVFLPQVATENNWDRPTMLRQLSLKAGLNQDDWMSGAEFCVFETQQFRESDEPKIGNIDVEG